MVTFYLDLIYSLGLTTDNIISSDLLDNDLFNQIELNCFCNDYIEDLRDKNGFVLKNKPFLQSNIDKVFKEFAEWFHETGKYDYAHSRNITDSQINEFKIGSTHILDNITEVDIFLKDLIHKGYDKKLCIRILTYHATLHQINFHHYGSSEMTTFPSFDNDGNCKGIVYRTEKYVPHSQQMRNLSKFYCSHIPSYIFNFKTLQNNDKLIFVEGVFDALALNRIGYNNVISVSYNRISKYHCELLKDKEVTFIFDPDKGGKNGLEFIKGLSLPNAKFATTPEMDVCDLVNLDPELFKKFYNKL